MASHLRGTYDPDLQMYCSERIPDMNKLRFWRWCAEQENRTIGPAQNTFDYDSTGEPNDLDCGNAGDNIVCFETSRAVQRRKNAEYRGYVG